VDVSWSKVTDAGVEALATCSWLGHLNISRCSAVSDTALLALSNAPRLVTLDVSRNKQLSDQGLTHFISAAAQTIEQQEKLREELAKVQAQLDYMITLNAAADRIPIEVFQEKEIKLQSQIAALEKLEVSQLAASVLQHVDLSFCIRITDSGIERLTRLPLITSLSVAHCHEVSDLAVAAAARCTELRKLSVAHCEKVTYHAVDLLLANSKELSVLDLSHCTNINFHMVDKPQLEESALHCVNLEGCPHISDQLREGFSESGAVHEHRVTSNEHVMRLSSDFAGVWHFDYQDLHHDVIVANGIIARQRDYTRVCKSPHSYPNAFGGECLV